MTKYQTEQRKRLYEFFMDKPHEAFTAAQIAQALCEGSISLSAVYRNLASITKEGLINRIVSPGSREIRYQFNHAQQCLGMIHITCTVCEKTYHVQKTIVDDITNCLMEKEGFKLDTSKTILYGVCSKCQCK